MPEELDRLLPELVSRFGRLGVRATFFVLGEVARRIPTRIRELCDAGHEVACHGNLHLRADDRSPEGFRRDVSAAKALLEELVGREVVGFRAPEWSLRRPQNPRFRIVAEVGFRYDSSLMPAPGAGAASNPRLPALARWGDGLALLELPPLVWGGPLGLPAGGWCGRCAPQEWIRRAARRSAFALFVVHPWELVDRPAPGLHTGFARFFHDAGRRGFGHRFERTIEGLPVGRTMAEVASAATASVHASAERVERPGGAGRLRTVVAEAR